MIFPCKYTEMWRLLGNVWSLPSACWDDRHSGHVSIHFRPKTGYHSQSSTDLQIKGSNKMDLNFNEVLILNFHAGEWGHHAKKITLILTITRPNQILGPEECGNTWCLPLLRAPVLTPSDFLFRNQNAPPGDPILYPESIFCYGL